MVSPLKLSPRFELQNLAGYIALAEWKAGKGRDIDL
jgi:hypothetical protein